MKLTNKPPILIFRSWTQNHNSSGAPILAPILIELLNLPFPFLGASYFLLSPVPYCRDRWSPIPSNQPDPIPTMATAVLLG
jgi:hypothetical protein